MNYTLDFLNKAVQSINQLKAEEIEALVSELLNLRNRSGRLFLIGSGGGAGHASHAAADFRRLAGIESYAVGDNVSELTALINDESWEESYAISLRQSKFSQNDALFVISVGGGDLEKQVSMNLVRSIDFCHKIGGQVFGVSSNSGGYLAQKTKNWVRITITDNALVTPISESLQALVWHLIACHPKLKIRPTYWESLGGVR